MTGLATLAPATRTFPTVVLWHLAGDSMVDFLASRGYLALQVNCRGSVGYGRAFRESGVGEFARPIQTDLRDGLADPRRVAIMGASYGGYASLVGMIFNPERFACGISVGGMSDIEFRLARAPPSWELDLPIWMRFVGDPADSVQREQMQQKVAAESRRTGWRTDLAGARCPRPAGSVGAVSAHGKSTA